MSKEQELKEMLKLYSKQDLWNRIQEKQAMIYDMEAKFAESEKEFETFKKEAIESYNTFTNERFKLKSENITLKQQLAQKEKLISGFANSLKENYDFVLKLEDKDNEIKQLKLDLGMFKSVNEFINSYGIEKAREVLLQTEKTKNQDKISFCIEQLEKVKEYAQHIQGGLINYIDNQIEELKKEMK